MQQLFSKNNSSVSLYENCHLSVLHSCGRTTIQNKNKPKFHLFEICKRRLKINQVENQRFIFMVVLQEFPPSLLYFMYNIF